MINLFKQNEGFSTSSFTGKVVDGIENIPDEIKDNLIQVDDSVYQDLIDHKLMWSNGELVNNPDYKDYLLDLENANRLRTKRNRIVELKQLLADSDYRAIKYAEGLYTEEEYAPYKEQRQAYRDEINQIESEIGNS